MVDTAQTAANVHAWSGATVILAQVEVAVEPGDWLYLDTLTLKYKLASGALGVGEALVAGMSLSYGPADTNYVMLCTAGDVDPGATLTVGGGPLIISAIAAGNFGPVADLTAGEFGTVLGTQIAADKFNIAIKVATVAFV